MMNLNELTITEASEKLRNKEISAVELTRACLDAIKRKEPEIHAYLLVCEKEALVAAEEIDRRRLQGEELGRLAGIPVAVKDIFCTKGVRTTAASKMLENYFPPYDATVVARLKEAGVVILGKTNLDAFAHGASTETSDFGVTHNPLDPTRIPGGSSGGSAAAVAAHECIGALGTQTGGSIMQPAALCGIVGLKPTYGRVSRYGLIAMASSLDCPGPMTKTVKDAALLLEAIAGPDEHDSTMRDEPVEKYSDACGQSIKGLRVGIPAEFFPETLRPEVRELVRREIERFKKLGAELREITLPHAKYASAVYAIIQSAEVSTNLARMDGVRFGHHEDGASDIHDYFSKSRRGGFGNEAKRRIMTGTFALSSGYYDAYYRKASQVRTIIREEFKKAFEQVDVIVGPCAPDVAQKIGGAAENPIFGYLADELINPSSISGLCGISVPCELIDGLPIGLQIVGDQFCEGTILKTASAYEKMKGFRC